MQVKIVWTQRAAGRDIGHVETVELTGFVQGCISANRVKVLERIEPPAPKVSIARRPRRSPEPSADISDVE